MLVDTHTHVNFQPYLSDYTEVINRALKNKVWIINVGTQRESSERSIQIAKEYNEGVYAAIGLHPLHLFHDVSEEQAIGHEVQRIRARAERFDGTLFRSLARSSKKVVAIGECGLDYYHFERSGLQEFRDELVDLQQQTLRQHCALALELNLPVMIHCRDAAMHTQTTVQAFDDILTVLRSYQGKLRGVIHCYTGLASYIPKFLELGFYIGFTGITTFPDAEEVQAAAKATPINRLLLETDAPYLTPHPHRGKRNEPAYVRFVAEAIARLKGKDVASVEEQTTANAFELFQLS